MTRNAVPLHAGYKQPASIEAGLFVLVIALRRLRDLAVEGQPVEGRRDMDLLAVVHAA